MFCSATDGFTSDLGMRLCRWMVLSHFMYNICRNKVLNSAVGRVIYRMLIFPVPTQYAVFQSTAGYWWRVQKEVSWFYWWRRQNCIRGWLDKNESKSHCVCVCADVHYRFCWANTYSSLGCIMISRCATIEIMNILLYICNIYICCQNDCCSHCCHFVSPICFYFKSLSFQ